MADNTDNNSKDNEDGGAGAGGGTGTRDMGDAEMQDESRNNSRSSYRQKYKHAWELDLDLKDWLTACHNDAYAAFCKFCRTKLHAHKKGLLAHAKSAKHKKHTLNPNYANDNMALMPSDSFNMPDHGDDVDMDDMDRGTKRNSKGQRLFNDSWLKDPLFSSWLRKVQSNNTKALCIACRCVISAGRCELIKHTRAAKHKKAILDGPHEEVGDDELQWLESSSHDQSGSQNMMTYSHQVNVARASMLDLPGVMVDEVIEKLNSHVPLEFAESWDNVGIITKPTQSIKIYSIILTIDLSVKVVEEAIKKRAQFIISYHPPIFRPIKNLNPKNWKDKAILMCIENKITVYSPHTALDAIKGGINDWLISSFMTNPEDKLRPIQYSKDKKNTACLKALLPETLDSVAEIFKDVQGCSIGVTEYANNSNTDVRITCSDNVLPELLETLEKKNYTHLGNRVNRLVECPFPGIGMGRIITFGTFLPMYEVVQRTKSHLNLNHLRLAMSPRHTRDTKVQSIAVCAGSGYGVLKDCQANVWITGEMSHHEVLDTVNRGTTVILCEHSNTERGFLREWSQQLRTAVFEDQLMVGVSDLDADPIRIV